MSNFIKRIVPVLLVLVLCISCLVSAVSASSFDNGFANCYNLLDYDTADGDNIVRASSLVANAQYTLPTDSIVTYVDIVVNTVGCDITEAYIGHPGEPLSGGDKWSINVLQIAARSFRLYGVVPLSSYDEIELSMVTTANGNCNIQSFLVSNDRISMFEETGMMVIQDQANGYDSYTQSSFGEAVNHNIYVNTNYRGQGFCVVTLHVPNWKKYDFVELSGSCRVSDISSVIAWADSISLPYNLTYLGDTVIGDISSGSDDTVTARRDFIITVDLRGVDRTIDNDYFTIVFECAYPFDQGGFFGLGAVHGIIQQETYVTDVYFFRNILDKLELFRSNFFTLMGSLQSNLSTWFTDLGNYLGNLMITINNNMNAGISNLAQKLNTIISDMGTGFSNVINELKKLNGSDSEAKDAQQTQEEVNVSINNQLVGAVEDWNTNIEVVETGYDLAVSKTTPALVWLSSLADGIFNGMGWFGNVYFLVGLISVIMLLLSKSGLAHRIGSMNRRRSG